MIFDLLMVLMGVKVFLAGMIMLYQIKYLLVHRLNLGNFGYMNVLSKMMIVQWILGD